MSTAQFTYYVPLYSGGRVRDANGDFQTMNVVFSGTFISMTQPPGPKPLSWSYNICLAEKRGKLMVWKARGWLKELHTLGVHPWSSR